MKHIFYIILIFFSFTSLFGQTKYVIIDTIVIEGNNRTKDYIIKNEIDISVGDTIYFNDLGRRFENNKNRILGTRLFVSADLNLKELNTESGISTLLIKVAESWYIYPKIIINLVDRNFNEWYYEHNASLKRINYGLGLNHINLSGNRDALELMFQRGVTNKFEIKYSRPFWNKNCKIGFNLDVFYKFSKELPYNTKYNKLVFIKENNKVLSNQFRVTSGFTFRPKIYDTQTINFSYFNSSIDSIILNNYNPDFFSGRLEQKYFLFSYSYTRDKRIYQLYPKGGFLLGGTIEKLGLGIYEDINQLNAYFSFEKYLYIKKVISTYIFRGKYRFFGKESPYFNNKAIGYEENVLSGYDLYVIDGKDYAYLKTAQKIKLFENVFDMTKVVPIKQFNKIPYEIYFSLNFDIGYVNNNVNFVENSFNNRILYGYGIGFDFIIYNNLFNINYSFNHLGEKGIFFYYKSSL